MIAKSSTTLTQKENGMRDIKLGSLFDGSGGFPLAGVLLFEREGVRGDFAQGRKARQGAADDAAGGAGGSCYAVYPEIARTLTARHDSSPCADRGQNVVVLDCRNLVGNAEISGTLQAKNEGGYSLNFVNPVVYDCRGNGSGNIVPNLLGDHQNRVTDYTAVCVGNGQMHRADVYPDVTGALCANSHPGSYTGQDAFNDMLPVYKNERRYIVRRLTPLECCRLQGFPDWWEDGANGSDSARYRMWGNGIALPCAADVLGRIAKEILVRVNIQELCVEADKARKEA